MTSETQNNQVIHSILEETLHQVATAQLKVTAVDDQLREIKSQIEHSLDTMDSALKQLETREQYAEQMRSDVAATLGAMFEQMTSLVNGTRDQMLHRPNDESATPVRPDRSAETPANEVLSTESLNGEQAGQRAATSLQEVIETIDETPRSQETKPAVQQKERLKIATTDSILSETENSEGFGSMESLSELLTQARALSDEPDIKPIEKQAETTPLAGEDEDAEILNELFKNTSGSFVAQ